MHSFKYFVAKVLKRTLNIPAIKNSRIHNRSKVCSGCNVLDVTMGKYSYIGNYSLIVKADIGNFCSISDYCYIGGAMHHTDWVSTSPVFHNGKNIMRKNFFGHEISEHKKTIIGNDVWIGSMCLIKQGVTIGNGAVIGMGSVVTKDVEPYTIVAGNPAKVIKKRFNKDVITKLEASKWWCLGDTQILTLSKSINDVEEFIAAVKDVRQDNILKK